jgi:hypothetical protein
MNAYEGQFNVLHNQFKKYYPAYKDEKNKGISTELTTNFLNVERNMNNLFKDMILHENEIDIKIENVNKTLKTYDRELSLYKKELKREKQELNSIKQRSSAGEQFKEQYDVEKKVSTEQMYYELFGIVGAIYLIYSFS